MRISILLPDLRGGGAERVNLDLASEFVRAGHEVEFVVMQPRGDLLAEAEAEFAIRSLACSRMRQVPLRLARYLRERQPDALLAAMWPLTGIAGLAVRISGSRVRLVASEHTDFRKRQSLRVYEKFMLKRFGPQLYGPCHRIVAVSAGVAESLTETASLPSSRISVIHNPVRSFPSGEICDSDRMELARWLEGEHRIIAIGSLSAPKGFDVLIRALAEIRAKLDSRLLILGDGPLKGELQELAVKVGVSESVSLPGFRKNPGAFLQHADVFVLSSNWEGFGNVITEALSAGVPAVSTDCQSGPAEILGGGEYGVLVPVGDHKALCAGVLKVVASPPPREKLLARAKDFHPAKQAKLYLKEMLTR